MPANDGPDDAIALHVGSRLNTSNVGASPEPEIQLANCPEGFFDQFGNTLWYTIEGTGSPVTIDTAGSNFDTLIAVYEPSDPGYEEIACIDDVEFEPVGATPGCADVRHRGRGDLLRADRWLRLPVRRCGCRTDGASAHRGALSVAAGVAAVRPVTIRA